MEKLPTLLTSPVRDMLSHPISPIPSPPYQKIGSGMSPLNYEPVSPDYLPPPESPPPPMAEQLSLLEERYPEPPPKRRHLPGESSDRADPRRQHHRQTPWRGSSSRHHRRTPWRPPYTRLASGLIEPHFHAKSRAVLCIRDTGFTLTNGFISYTMDRNALYPVLLEHVQHLRVGKLIFTDEATRLQWKMLVERGRTNFDFSQVPNYKMSEKNLEPCPLCHQSNCHRHIAVEGIRRMLNTKDVERIPHPVLRF
ncbi:hypothetical protein JTE90_016957 [Oedothorax gibbosus]|uniref:Uncharacterized protein n=1 Tax=Oedothorax gibbosus TaxID=931172 RepID=A0AAV6TNP9_9ARAC|nr:hypothetical protein JTE90_016957 [Oedothorax gibbosus]